MKRFIVVIFMMTISLNSYSQKVNPKLVIYDNYTFIFEKMVMNVQKGSNAFSFQELPLNLMDNAVFIYLPQKDGLNVISKNLHSNPFSIDKLIIGELNKDVELISKDGKIVSGKLINVTGSRAAVEVENGKVRLINLSDYEFTELEYDKDRFYDNKLSYTVLSGKREKVGYEIGYFTGDLNWNCEHLGTYNPGKGKLDLSSWVKISSNMNFDIKNADVTLVSGSIRRPETSRRNIRADFGVQAKAMADNLEQGGFSVEETFEYYSFKYPDPVDLKRSGNIELQLYNRTGIDVKKVFVYNGRINPNDIFVSLELKNEKNNNLGIPLPKGMVKLFSKEDSELSYIGADYISDTPAGKDLNLKIGKSFDLKGERIRKEFRRITNRITEEVVNIILSNGSDKDVEIKVIENLAGDWTIQNSNFKYSKVSSNTIEYIIPVKAQSSGTIEYTVRIK